MNLGRFQLGQSVRIGIDTVDGSGNPAAPIAAPIASMFAPDSVPFSPQKLAMDGGSMSFALHIHLNADFALGTYSVTYSYTTAGHSGTGSDTFDVIAGGDPGGRIISMAAYDRADARYVVAQLSSGRIVQGRNPSI